MVTEGVRRAGPGNEGPHIGRPQRGRARCPRHAVCFVWFFVLFGGVFCVWWGVLFDRLVCLAGLSGGMFCLVGCFVWGMFCLAGCYVCGVLIVFVWGVVFDVLCFVLFWWGVCLCDVCW